MLEARLNSEQTLIFSKMFLSNYAEVKDDETLDWWAFAMAGAASKLSDAEAARLIDTCISNIQSGSSPSTVNAFTTILTAAAAQTKRQAG